MIIILGIDDMFHMIPVDKMKIFRIHEPLIIKFFIVITLNFLNNGQQDLL